MSVETERSAGRTSFVVLRAALIVGLCWYLTVGLERLGEYVLGRTGTQFAFATPNLLFVAAAVVAVGVVFSTYTYWYYRGGLLGMLSA